MAEAWITVQCPACGEFVAVPADLVSAPVQDTPGVHVVTIKARKGSAELTCPGHTKAAPAPPEGETGAEC